MPSLDRHGGLQNRCSCTRKTTTFLKTDALVYAKRSDSNLGHFLAGPSKPSWGQPGTNASRAAKKKGRLVQVNCLSILPGWKVEVVAVPGTSAPVHAKRLVSSKGTLSST